jgi:hypothetical protein
MKGSESNKQSKKKAHLSLKEKRLRKKEKRAKHGGHDHSEEIIS